MARGRFIVNEITKDKRINQLSDDTSRLAFTWLITFADCEGRTMGDPAIVRSLLFPRRDDVGIERMRGYIQEWHDAGLIIWYEAKGDLFIFFPAFDRHNAGIRKDREAASNIPAPELVQSNSGVTQEKDTVNININSNDKDKKNNKVSEKGVVEGGINARGETSAAAAFQRTEWIDTSQPLYGVTESQAERAFQKATGMPTFPGKSAISDIKRIQSISSANNLTWEETADYLRDFFNAWVKRNYSRTNTDWLDWAIAGEVPKSKAEKMQAVEAKKTEKASYIGGAHADIIKH